ncbi:ABC transporter permease [Staphylococcus epidermidis]|nr:ABC transporter permease [Staphylococcus epidermidis]
MIHYIKFEIKNTFSYSIGMIVGGLLPLLLAIGGYHSTGNSVQNKVAAETLFATCLPMIPLGLVMLPFTISFAKDNESGISKRFSLFGYGKVQQMIAKFISIIILVTIVSLIYYFALMNILPLPRLSEKCIILAITGILIFTLSFYFLAFTIAWFFRGFNAVQGIAMVVYFGIGILTGTIGGFEFHGYMKKISNFIPFKSFRETLAKHWTQNDFSLEHVLYKLFVFFVFSLMIFLFFNLYSFIKKRPEEH